MMLMYPDKTAEQGVVPDEKLIHVMDGPFTESKEIIGGYRIIQVKSKEEAVEWAKRVPSPDSAGEGMIELRQIFEMSDSGPEIEEQEGKLVKDIEAGLAKNAKR